MNTTAQIPIITDLNYTYKKPDTDVWVLNSDDIPLDKSKVHDSQIVHFAPKSFGGNHKHPRTEWFIGIGNLLLVWLDEKGERHEEEMNPNGKLKFIEMPSFVPHVVVNQSTVHTAVLFEYADAKMGGVEPVKVK